MQITRLELPLGSVSLILETGKLAKQAHGAVVVSLGETLVLVTAVEGGVDPKRDFFPLTVDYREKTYAAGKFPGGYIKRETRPTTKETLTSRLIDRPIRPLFPLNYLNEVQVMCSTLSADRDYDPDVLALIGASAALHISHIPFVEPTGGVRVGRVGGQLVVMPTYAQLEESDLDLVVSGTKSAITMIEGFAREMPEEEMLKAILFAHEHIRRIVEAIEQFRTQAGLPVKVLPAAPVTPALHAEVLEKFGQDFVQAKYTPGKAARAAAISAVKDKIKAIYLAADRQPPVESSVLSGILSQIEEKVVREAILSGKRLDGRQEDEIRALHCETDLLPRVHGSALFQRGETQALVSVTLGTSSDEQRMEGLVEEFSKKFMLDYNFPPFSVGECKPIRGPGRREIGHGALAERSLKAIVPPVEEFPYTIRLVSDILESNGSSSMASVCGGTLALMDAGVPILNPVAGISIGLVQEGDRHILLTDIQGDEDHYGDMDFKVAGTTHGITALQMDIKIQGITKEIMQVALAQAKEARMHILGKMQEAMSTANTEVSDFAPKLFTMKINPEKIRDVIGKGGATIRALTEETGCQINIGEDGTITIAATDGAKADVAKQRIEQITAEVEIGKVYEGPVTKILDFGALINLLPGKDGLLHISQIAHERVEKVTDYLSEGQIVKVKVMETDEKGRIKLSMKALLDRPAQG